MLSEEDRVKFDSLIDDLGPNEFLGNYTFPLTTESGEKKFIQVNARPIYDEDGKFLRRSEFAQDITQDVLNDQQLLSLTSTVEDVQTATAISVHYLDGDGKFVWTNESYKIVGREPRDGDEDTHIIAGFFQGQTD